MVKIKQELDKAEDDSKFFSVGNKEERQYIRFALLKVYELKEECKARGLIQSGIKKDLIARLAGFEVQRGKTLATAVSMD